MALSTKHRLALYEHFRAQVGDEVTEALLSEFPARDDDELVTNKDLLVTKNELRSEISALRAEMHGGFAEVNRHITTVFVGMTSLFVVALAVATTLIIAVGG